MSVEFHSVQLRRSVRACQVRTSYLPSEICWGECLVPLIMFEKHDGRYCIDFKQFHETRPVEMARCSACEWQERRAQREADNKQSSADFPGSFKSGMSRSSSFPSQPALRGVGFALVGKAKKRTYRGDVEVALQSTDVINVFSTLFLFL